MLKFQIKIAQIVQQCHYFHFNFEVSYGQMNVITTTSWVKHFEISAISKDVGVKFGGDVEPFTQFYLQNFVLVDDYVVNLLELLFLVEILIFVFES